MNLKLNHLYSQNLNIYGDLGNIIAFKYKAEKAGINEPSSPMTIRQLTNFLTKAEIVWRWKYADLMMKGRD